MNQNYVYFVIHCKQNYFNNEIYLARTSLQCVRDATSFDDGGYECVIDEEGKGVDEELVCDVDAVVSVVLIYVNFGAVHSVVTVIVF